MGLQCQACLPGARALVPLVTLIACALFALYLLRRDWKSSSATLEVCLFYMQLNSVLHGTASGAASGGGSTAWTWLPDWTQRLASLQPLAVECVGPCDTHCQFAILAAALSVPSALVVTAIGRRVWSAARGVEASSHAGSIELNSAAAGRPQASVVADGEPVTIAGHGELHTRHEQRAGPTLWTVAIYIAHVVYFPVASRALETFNCEAFHLLGGLRKTVLSSAPYAECSGAAYSTRATVSALLLVVVLALPALELWQLWRHRGDVERAPAHRHMRFLWSSLRSAALWWWPVILVTGRKLLLAGVLALLPFGSAWVPVTVVLLLFATIALQVACVCVCAVRGSRRDWHDIDVRVWVCTCSD